MYRSTSFLLLFFLGASSYGDLWIPPSEVAEIAVDNSAEFQMRRRPDGRCHENGIFPVLKSCQKFYHCSDWGGADMQTYEFTCSLNTVFDDRLDLCVHPSMVSTRPECLTENVQDVDAVSYNVVELYTGPELERTKRSSSLPSSEENCTQQDIEIAAESAKDACVLIYHVDKYVIQVRSMIPVVIPEYVTHEEYRSIVDEYNGYLEDAQNHTYVWRNGDDILSGIRRSYELAKLFGPEFHRKYRIMQDRLSKLQNGNSDNERILRLEMKIRELKEENTNITAMLPEVPPKFQNYFLGQYKRNDEDIMQAKEEIKTLGFSVIKELKEMISFMKFVKEDAGAIESKANATRAKIKVFKDNVIKDKEAFSKSIDRSKQGIVNLERERNDTEALIKQIKAMKRETETERQKERQRADEIESKMEAAIQDMKDFMKRNSLSADAAHEHRSTGSKWLAFPIIGWIVGGVMHSDANKRLKSLADERKARFDLLKQELDALKGLLQIKDRELERFSNDIRRQEDRANEKREGLKKLTFVDMYLEDVIADGEMILPLIEKAEVSLLRMEDIFDNIVFHLEGLIYKAEEVQGEAESRDLQYLIYLELSDMEVNWNASYADITSLGRCTNEDFIQMLFQPPVTTTTELPVNVTETIDLLNNSTTVAGINNTLPIYNVSTEIDGNVQLFNYDYDYDNSYSIESDTKS